MFDLKTRVLIVDVMMTMRKLVGKSVTQESGGLNCGDCSKSHSNFDDRPGGIHQ